MFIRRGRTDVGVDDEQNGVGELHGDLGLGRYRGVDALGVGFPAAGVHQGEAAHPMLGLVGDAITGDARRVLHNGFAAAEDAVDERRLADVRTADDREHGKRGQIDDRVGVIGRAVQDAEVVLVQLIVQQAGTQGVRALQRISLIERSELLAQLGIELGIVVPFEVLVCHWVSF